MPKPKPKPKTDPGRRTANSWVLYLIECANGALYAGITNDLPRRFAAHAAGRGAKYTRANPPVRLVAFRRYADKSAAARAEYAVRRLAARDKPAFVRGARPHRPGAEIAKLMESVAAPAAPRRAGGSARKEDPREKKMVARRGEPDTPGPGIAAERAGAKDRRSL